MIDVYVHQFEKDLTLVIKHRVVFYSNLKTIVLFIGAVVIDYIMG